MEETPLDNIHFIRMDAENIVNVFEKGEVDQIYLNFSDPWPKDRHAKRRLTSRQFLERYHNILKEEGRVIFKTDNRPLFDFSLEEVEELEHAGYQRVSLGSRILRAETAAMSMIDRIGFYYDEMAGELHAKHGDDSE